MCLSVDIGCDNTCGCCGKPSDYDVCPDCQKDVDYREELISQGHTYHCASRMSMGDGECECELKGIQPPEGSISYKILTGEI